MTCLIPRLRTLLAACLFLWGWCSCTYAEDSALSDRNGDEVTSLACFGDSITAGLGDGPDTAEGELPRGGGYPARLTTMLGLPVSNLGKPGELLIPDAAERLPGALSRPHPDVVTLMHGANDANLQRDSREVATYIQREINIARVLGSEPVLITIPPPCCDHESLQPFTRSYSAKIRELAARNELLLVDAERAWDSTCARNACSLFNLPDGLHPSPGGYDAIAQTVAAAFYGINIFAPDGASQLEDALGLPAGSVIVKPDEQ